MQYNKEIYKNQRVAIFVDIQNIFYSARNTFDRKVNFVKLIELIVAKRNLFRAIAYAIKLKGINYQSFVSTLKHIGYQVKEKEPKIFISKDDSGNQIQTIKADWDMGLAMDAIILADKIDVAILVSGDGDFTELIRFLKTKGVKVEIAAFAQTAAKELIENADEFIDLNYFGDEIFIPKVTDDSNLLQY